MRFKLFIENYSVKRFLQQFIQDFPNDDAFLVMSDFLEEEGENHLANEIRNVMKKEKVSDEARRVFATENMIFDRPNHRLHITQEDQRHRVYYEWHGHKLFKFEGWSGADPTPTEENLDSIENPILISALALLAAEQKNSHIPSHGMKRKSGSLTKTAVKQLENLPQAEKYVRLGLRNFLNWFTQLHELVSRYRNYSRRNRPMEDEIIRLMNRNLVGYIFKPQIAISFLKDYHGPKIPLFNTLATQTNEVIKFLLGIDSYFDNLNPLREMGELLASKQWK